MPPKRKGSAAAKKGVGGKKKKVDVPVPVEQGKIGLVPLLF